VAEVISRPRYFEEHTAQRLEGLTEELGAAVTEQALTSILEQIVFETGAARRAPRHAVTEVIETVARELIVVLERSPALGSRFAGSERFDSARLSG
jgi:hypothetical protein